MKKKTKSEPFKVYEVRTFVRARNAFEARRLAKTQEPHEITLLRHSEAPEHVHTVDAYAFLETEDEDYEVPDEYSQYGYKKDR